MDDPPRNIREISSLQFEFERRFTALMHRSIKVLPAQREFDGRAVECPAFRPCDLQHKHVVRIVMVFGPFCSRWGQIDVSLERKAKFAFEATAQGGKRRNPGVQVCQGYGRAFLEK